MTALPFITPNLFLTMKMLPLFVALGGMLTVTACRTTKPYEAARDPREAREIVERMTTERNMLLERLKYLDGIMDQYRRSMMEYDKSKHWQSPRIPKNASGATNASPPRALVVSPDRRTNKNNKADSPRASKAEIASARALVKGGWNQLSKGEAAILESNGVISRSEETLKKAAARTEKP